MGADVRHPSPKFREEGNRFQGVHLEELLLPLGRELARSYYLDHRKEEAIELLDKIANGKKPFDRQSPLIESEGGRHREGSRQHWPRVTVQPILALLCKLTGNEQVQIVRLDEDICLAEIQGKDLRVFSIGGMEVLRSGTLFDEGRALVGLVFPGQIPFAKGTIRMTLGSLLVKVTCT